MSSTSDKGFVSLAAVKAGKGPDAAQALAELRTIYFKTTRQTIDDDLAQAIALLKSLESEEQRDKAAVFMEGLAEMRREWAQEARKSAGRQPSSGGKAGAGKPSGGTAAGAARRAGAPGKPSRRR